MAGVLPMGGVAIGFNGNRLREFLAQLGPACELRSCHYGDSDDIREHMIGLVRATSARYQFSLSPGEKPDPDARVAFVLNDLLWHCSAIKQRYFSNEQEWRVIVRPPQGERNIDVFPSRTGLSPAYLMMLDLSVIDSIMIAPHSPSRSFAAVEAMVQIRTDLRHIKVSRSKGTYTG